MLDGSRRPYSRAEEPKRRLVQLSGVMTDAEATVAAGREERKPLRLDLLYEQHATDAARLAYLLTGDREVARDLVNEAFLRLAARLVDLRNPDAFAAYLRGMIVNLSKMHFRRRALETRHAELLRDQPSTPSDPAERDRLRRALLTLPERQRAAIVLRYYLDLSEKAISEILRCRIGTVKSLTSRGITALRPLLGDELHE